MSAADPEALCLRTIIELTTAADAANAQGMPHLASALVRIRQSTRKAALKEKERAMFASKAKTQSAVEDKPLFSLELPFHTVNEANTHKGWRAKHAARGDLRPSTTMAVRAYASRVRFKPPLPCVVRLTRLAEKTLDHGEGVVSAMKSVRDGVADWAGVDDGNTLITYVYAQEIRKAFGVRIEFFAVEQSQARSA